MKTTLTSAQAAKMIRKLKIESDSLMTDDAKRRSFVASVGEDVESVRPEYDYAATQEKLAEIEQKIRRLKHALNVFNSTTVIPEFGFTIDEMLVYIPQLTARIARLKKMSERLPKERINPGTSSYSGARSNIVEYSYANYDVSAAKADYERFADELTRAQLALDTVNNKMTLEVDV